MICKTITYTNYEDIEKTKKYWFHLSEADLRDMNFSKSGGMAQYLQKIVDSKDMGEIVSTFEKLILKGYGIKSDDGDEFMKSKEISDRFRHSAAYDILIDELLSGTTSAAEFFIGMLPKKFQGRVREEIEKNPDLLTTGKLSDEG